MKGITVPEAFRIIVKGTATLAVILVAAALSSLLRIAFLLRSREAFIRLNAKLIIRPFSSLLLKLLNVRVIQTGGFPDSYSVLVANHWGYIDSLIFLALSPCLVLSNTNIRKILGFGRFMESVGFLFVDRNRRASIPRTISASKPLIRKTALNYLFYPAGRAGDGDKLLPFHSSFFQVAIEAGVSVWPFAILLRSVNGEKANPSNRSYFALHATDTSLFRHIFRFLTIKSMVVEVASLEMIPHWEIKRDKLTRKDLCALCENRIREKLLEDKEMSS